jgi:hypothetical protein
LGAFPVLPAAFRESAGGRGLDPLYERVLRALGQTDAGAVDHALAAICQLLLPIVVGATAWNIEEASLLARGVALVPRREGDDGRCQACGFPLAGLQLKECPGCGKKLEQI